MAGQQASTIPRFAPNFREIAAALPLKDEIASLTTVS
jgi:hypothetical protein